MANCSSRPGFFAVLCLALSAAEAAARCGDDPGDAQCDCAGSVIGGGFASIDLDPLGDSVITFRLVAE